MSKSVWKQEKFHETGQISGILLRGSLCLAPELFGAYMYTAVVAGRYLSLKVQCP